MALSVASLRPNPNPILSSRPSLRHLSLTIRRNFSTVADGIYSGHLHPSARPFFPCLKAVTSEMAFVQGECPHTMMEFFGKRGANVGDDLAILLAHIEYACKRIAALVASPFSSELGRRPAHGEVGVSSSGRDDPKPLDIVSNDIILSSLKSSGKVAVMASEEDDLPVWISDAGPFVVVVDPLDGSRNIDVSIPTGTIFGIYNRLEELDCLPLEEKAQLNALQCGTRLVAAGYALYSSATILCLSFGSGTHAFTLDRSTGDFVLTHPCMQIPPRDKILTCIRQIYSVNDARYFDWPDGLRRYIDTVRQGFVIDPAKCNELSLEEKRELVHEISRWADNAPEILQSWTRRELLQLICAEMGKDRKYTGVTKPKMIEHLLRLVSQKNGKKCDDKPGFLSNALKNQNGTKKKMKKEQPLQPGNDLLSDLSNEVKEEIADRHICQNLVCRATLSLIDAYCKRCSCCICYQYDDNKDPSLWLVCSSDPPYCGDSCGMSCHLKCALKHEKAGILKSGCSAKLDGSFYCVCCGKLNWLIGSWRKQLIIAKDARRVDVLCERLFLSDKILKGTECYKELYNIVNAAVKKLKKEVGPLDKVSTVMARGIVNRLACGAEIQKLCSYAVETAGSMLSGSFDLMDNAGLNIPGPHDLCIQFEDLSPTSVVVALHSRDEVFEENIIGCRLWHRSSEAMNYPEKPSRIILRPETRITISGLCPSTEYFFRAAPFSSTKEFGRWESNCFTRNPSGTSSKVPDLNYVSSSLKKEQEIAGQPIIIQTDSQRGSTNSSDDHQAIELYNHGSKVQPLDDNSDNSDSNMMVMEQEPGAFVGSNSVPTETPSKPNREIDTPGSANKESMERDYEYCVKVIRWLECEGHMEKEFRVKFLTWFSLKATQQERRVVSTFIDVLIDEPASLVAQLADAFMDGICSKKPAVQRGFCSRLWH